MGATRGIVGLISALPQPRAVAELALPSLRGEGAPGHQRKQAEESGMQLPGQDGGVGGPSQGGTQGPLSPQAPLPAPCMCPEAVSVWGQQPLGESPGRHHSGA